jgi:septal ring factor EnvC (AmiA/AmiB activator)
MGFLSAVKWVSIAAMAMMFLGGVYYVMNLKESLAISESNNMKLEQSVADQAEVIEAKRAEIKQIQKANQELTATVQQQQEAIDKLNEKFNVSANGQSRDFGAITRVKPELIERIINRATDNVNRCFEIATGAPLEEGEKNNECQELINSISQ